jgi:uncharacterized NAD(P)/FAD-binding protein YdhS
MGRLAVDPGVVESDRSRARRKQPKDDLHRRRFATRIAAEQRADPLRIGLDVAEDYTLIDERGRPSRRIQVIGPLARAAFRECTAIPDIRLQCRDIAEGLATAEAVTA